MIKSKKFELLLFSYLIFTIILPIFTLSLFQNYLNPLFCLLIITYLVWHYFRHNLPNLENSKHSLIISLLFLSIYFALGFIFGFGKNPYNQDIISFLKNAFVYIIPIIALELSRIYLVKKYKNNKKALILITILTTLLEINYGIIFKLLDSRKYLFRYLITNVLPLIGENILFTYLVYKYNSTLPLIMKLINKTAILSFPILPNLNSFLTGSFKLIELLLLYIIFQYHYIKKESLRTFLTYLITLFLSTILVLFMAGLFKYKPIAIVTGSMNPTFNRGDFIIYKSLSNKELENLNEGTIIVFKVNNKYIAHRIVQKVNENGNISYITKGDSNNVNDSIEVNIKQIKGEYIARIKYLGYPSIWLNEYLNNNVKG